MLTARDGQKLSVDAQAVYRHKMPTLQIGSGDSMDGGVINMLIFYCNYCNEMLTGGDYESTDQIVDRLDEHLTKCPLSTFTHEGTSGIARRRLSGLPSFLEGERLAQLHSPVPTEFEKLSERIAELKRWLRWDWPLRLI